MRLRLLVLAAIACYAAFIHLKERPADGPTSVVLGAALSLSDAISGTYNRPEESGRRKAKVQLASRKVKRKTTATRKAYASRKPKTRNLMAGYRTLCVRLCDGYYFPISAAAEPGEFARDEETCRASCSSPAMLFVYKNGEDSTPETMTSLDGKPYTSLATAFKHRVSYDATCACNASPWTETAAERHRLYAAEESVLKGDKTAEPARRELAAAVQERRRKVREKTGADLVASRVAEVVAGGSHQRHEAPGVRKAAVRAPVVRTKVRDAERHVRTVRHAERKARATRATRAAATNRVVARRMRVASR